MALTFHHLAEIFPLSEGADFESLVSDIRANGLHEPIVLFEGSILDGRNRYRACLEAGIEPITKDFEGDDPLAYVVSLNLMRRHLNESQRAMIAANIANMRQGTRTDLQPSANRPEVSQTQAAEMLNVGERTVRRAVEVRDHAVPELVEQVERGDVSVSAAANVARLPEPEQRKLAAAGPEAVKDAARESREKKPSMTDGWVTEVLPTDRALSAVQEIVRDGFKHVARKIAENERADGIIDMKAARDLLAKMVEEAVDAFDDDVLGQMLQHAHAMLTNVVSA